MPGGIDIELHASGFPLVSARLAALRERGARWSKETAERGAQAGAKAMRTAAPDGKNHDPRGLLVQPDRPEPLKDRIRPLHTATAVFSPGGVGGGGTWEAKFGVIGSPGNPVSSPPTHDPAWIYTHGSGERGDRFASHSPITASIPGNVMTWLQGGKQWYARSTRGQRPHPVWIERGKAAAKREIRRRMVEFDLR